MKSRIEPSPASFRGSIVVKEQKKQEESTIHHANTDVSEELVYVNTVIVGGGQSGLAMARCLVDHGIQYQILEQRRLVERWKSERWESLRLLTPNWMTQLPGNYQYSGNDPNGFMTASETVQFFEDYARSFDANIQTHTRVIRISMQKDDFLVETDKKTVYKAHNVVVATGFCDVPRLPSWVGANKNDSTLHLVPSEYKRPSQVHAGNVLIVGASATGCQIAQEILQHSKDKNIDRKVFLSVGSHTRLPRCYRGCDILYWLTETGFFSASSSDRRSQERLTPAPQIVGTPEKRDLDLRILQSLDVELLGHLKEDHIISHRGELLVLQFENDLKKQLTSADSKLEVLLQKIDAHIDENNIDAPLADVTIEPVPCPQSPRTQLSLKDDNITTIVWATGYCRSFPWLKQLSETGSTDLLEPNGDICQYEGVTPLPDLSVLGMRFQRTPSSNFIGGVGPDAKFLATHIVERNRNCPDLL